jgi:hypothetical protein
VARIVPLDHERAIDRLVRDGLVTAAATLQLATART